MVQANRIRPGSIIIFNGELCSVMGVKHLTPGNLRALVQAKLRNLRSGNQFENRFRATEEVEQAFLETHKMEYLYDDGERYHLMNIENYEQIDVGHDMMGEVIQYLLPNTQIDVTFYEGKPVGIELPKTVELKVAEAEPSVKKQTASASYKKAVLETGLVVQVPPFVEVGDVIKVDTETGEYLERSQKA
ncbi:MAG: elongation factor P [Pseudomonadota bacterium]